MEQLLADKLQKHDRKSFIYSHRTYTEYPFQVNIHGLPPEVVRECVMGFITTLLQPASASDAKIFASNSGSCRTSEGNGQALHGSIQRKAVEGVAG